MIILNFNPIPAVAAGVIAGPWKFHDGLQHSLAPDAEFAYGSGRPPAAVANLAAIGAERSTRPPQAPLLARPFRSELVTLIWIFAFRHVPLLQTAHHRGNHGTQKS